MYRSCAIISHRPVRFKFKYNESDTDCKRLKKRLRDEVMHLYEKGVRHFWVGGALGVDMWVGEILLRLKEKPAYADINFMLALPFEGHDVHWDKRSKKRMNFLRLHCDQLFIPGASRRRAANSYRRSSKFVVDQADCLLAVYDNNRTIQSDTGTTVRYAEEKHLHIILIHPDTGGVTDLTALQENL